MAEKRRKASVVISPAALPPARHMPLLCSHLVYKNLPQTHRQLVPHRRRPHLFSPDHTRDGFRLALQVSKCLSKRRALRWDLRTQTFSSCPPPPPAPSILAPSPTSKGKPGDRLLSVPWVWGARGLEGWGQELQLPTVPKGKERVLGRTGLPPTRGKSLGLLCSTRSRNHDLKDTPPPKKKVDPLRRLPSEALLARGSLV